MKRPERGEVNRSAGGMDAPPVVQRIFRAINLRLRYRVDERGADCD